MSARLRRRPGCVSTQEDWLGSPEPEVRLPHLYPNCTASGARVPALEACLVVKSLPRGPNRDFWMLHGGQSRSCLVGQDQGLSMRSVRSVFAERNSVCTIWWERSDGRDRGRRCRTAPGLARVDQHWRVPCATLAHTGRLTGDWRNPRLQPGGHDGGAAPGGRGAGAATLRWPERNYV